MGIGWDRRRVTHKREVFKGWGQLIEIVDMFIYSLRYLYAPCGVIVGRKCFIQLKSHFLSGGFDRGTTYFSHFVFLWYIIHWE